MSSAEVEAAILSRRSVRAFTAQAVSRETLNDLLALASRAPSGTNTQPWRVYVLQGASQAELADKVCAAHDAIRANPALATRLPGVLRLLPAKMG